MEKYLSLLQIFVSLAMIALATFIGELVKAHEEKKKISGWHYWHHGLANAQWGFASFYMVLIWTQPSAFVRIAAFALVLVSATAFGFSTAFASRIAQSVDSHCSATKEEKSNNWVAGISFVVALGVAVFLIFAPIK